MRKSVLDLKTIAFAGGNIIVSAEQYSVLDLKLVASSGGDKGAKLLIKQAKKLSTLDCKIIAAANPGNVTFDFQD